MRLRTIIVAILVGAGMLLFGSIFPLLAAPPASPSSPDPGGAFPSITYAGEPVPVADGWATPVNVSNNSSASGGPVLGVDRQGTVHLAWYDNDPGNWEIFYASQPVTGTWTQPEDISNNASFSLVPFLAVQPNDSVHVVWQDYGGPRGIAWQGTLLFKSREPGQEFGPPEAISPTTGFGGFPEVRDPDLAVDSQETIHLAWAGNSAGSYHIFYAEKPLGGEWSFPSIMSSGPGKGNSYHPHLAIDGADRLHIVWQETLEGDSQADIYYSTLGANGVWAAPVNLSANSGQSQGPSLVAGRDGTLHVVWQDYTLNADQSEILYTRKPAGAGWSPAENISATPGDSAGPILVEDGAGTLHIVWYDNAPGNWEILYAMKPLGGAWTSVANLSNTPGLSGQPFMVYDQRGRLHVAWVDNTPGEFDIYYTSKAVPVLGTSLKQGPTTALPGDGVWYEIIVRSVSPQPVAAVVTDSMPAEMTYVEGSAEAGAGELTVEGQMVQWTGNVPARGEVHIRLRVEVHVDAPIGTVIRNQAVISQSDGTTVTVEARTRVNQTRVMIPIIVQAN